jgi:hypothetical protein
MAAGVALWACNVDGTLDATGGARVQIRYRLVSVANFEPSKKRLQSADVRLASATMAPDKWATFDLEMADVRKLSTAPAFADTTVQLTDEADGARTLAMTLVSKVGELPAPLVKYLGNEFRVAIELPGDIVRSNATAVAGRRASWVLPITGKRTDFSVTFKPAPG